MTRSMRIWTGIAAGVVALAVATPALAQDGAERMRTRDPEKRIERLDEMLDLTDSQEAELRALFVEQAEKGRALRESGDREAVHEHMRATHERIASVLTEEQRQKFEALRREHREEHRSERGERKERSGERRQGGDESRHAPDDAEHRDDPGAS